MDIGNLLSGLLGAVIGFVGAVYIEKRKERQRRAAVVYSVLLEAALLAATLEEAVKSGRRTREKLTKENWDRHGAELINYLPFRLVKALWVMFDEFDSLQTFYGLLVEGVTKEQKKHLDVALLRWVYMYEEIQKRINDFLGRRRGFLLPWNRQSAQDAAFTPLRDELRTLAINRLRKEGHQVDQEDMEGFPLD